MPGIKDFFRRLSVFPIFAGLALAWGLLIPVVFEWGEKPAAQSKRPEMETAALIVLSITAVVSAVCWYCKQPAPSETPTEETRAKFQFGIRQILVATTLVAILLAGFASLKLSIASLVVIVVIAFVGLWATLQNWAVRGRVATLLASMYLPLFWMILYNRPIGYSSGLIEVIPVGPAIVAGFLLRGPNNGGLGVAAALAIIELFLGAWLAKRGGKISIAYLILILLLSCFNSFVLHVLYRA